MAHHNDDGICDIFDFKGRYKLLRHLFPMDQTHQLMLVQSLASEADAGEYGAPTDYKVVKSLDRPITKTSSTYRSIGAVAPPGSRLMMHTENLILQEIKKVIWTDREHDSQRILIVVSKYGPCRDCQRLGQLRKMCNGFGKIHEPPNDHRRFGNCIFLFATSYQDTQNWMNVLFNDGWEIGRCYVPKTPTPTMPKVTLILKNNKIFTIENMINFEFGFLKNWFFIFE